MKHLMVGLIGLALWSAPAQAQNNRGLSFPAINGGIDQVYTYGEAQCRRMGLHLRTNMDTVFGVEDADGRGTPGFVVGPLECGDTANPTEDSTRQEFVDCRRDECKQWFVLGEGRRARLVWNGYTPQLSGILGLRSMTPACTAAGGGSASECPRVYWNGTTFTRNRPGRVRARRHR